VSALRLAVVPGFGADEVGGGFPRRSDVLDRRTRGIVEEALAGRPFRQPDRAELAASPATPSSEKSTVSGFPTRSADLLDQAAAPHAFDRHAPRAPDDHRRKLALKADHLPDVDMRPRRNVVVPIARKLTIFQLTEKTCKWPIGDPAMMNSTSAA